MLDITLWFIKQGNLELKFKEIELDSFINWDLPEKYKVKGLGNIGYGIFDR